MTQTENEREATQSLRDVLRDIETYSKQPGTGQLLMEILSESESVSRARRILERAEVMR